MKPFPRIAFVLLACLGAGSGTLRASPDVRSSGWQYHLTVSPGLESLGVRICFQGEAPGRLIVDQPAGFQHLKLPREVVPDGRNGARLQGVPPGGCIEYGVDAAAFDTVRSAGERAWAVTKPTRWLLRPERRPTATMATLTVDLPAGMSFSAPWPRTVGPDGRTRYFLDESAYRFEGRIAFGRFTLDEFEAAGGTVEVAVLGGPIAATREGIRRWLTLAAEAEIPLHGRLPVPRVQVLVTPRPGGGQPVGYGETRVGGGGGVMLLLSARAKDSDLPGEWVAVHEFAHLGLPAFREGESWLQEGLPTYYQEVLRARTGLQTEVEAWQEIHSGFQRGLSVGGERPLSEESQTMHATHNYWRVYWAGAALSLRLDLELSRATGGKWNLDEAVRFWKQELGGAPRLWTADELLKALDARVGQPVAALQIRPWLSLTRFPRFDDLYAGLGIVVKDGRVSLDDSAPAAAERRRIMAGPPRGS